MNDSTEKTNGHSDSQCGNCGLTPAFLLLRLWLGLRALLAGIEKYGAYKAVQKPLLDPTTGQPDASGAMLDVKVKFYSLANYHGVPPALRTKFENEVLLPGFTLNLFDTLLGPALIATGVMLLLGLGTRTSLFLQGLIYTMLTVGLILINQPDGIAWLGIHVTLVAAALVLAKHNKLALLKKW
jgi:thiosulfate dehydrogenase [quinone] large subunit